MSAGQLRRCALAAAAAMALLIGAVVAAQPQPTTAAFTDDAYAQATVSAGELVAPTITSCTVRASLGLVFQSVTITWTSPYGTGQVRLTDEASETTELIDVDPVESEPVNGLYTYSATIESNLLESLLGNLLGSTTTLTVSNVYSDHWVSPTRSRQLDIALLGLTSSCT